MTSFTHLTGSTAGATLASGWYYIDSNVTYSNTAGNGITIGANDVKIFIKKGCSLTVTAKNGSTSSAGYAGIYLTTGNLYVYGSGSLNVTGGNAGNATNAGTLSITGQSAQTVWRAPSGGTGGGGAGAGIGTNGGAGGTGGTFSGTGAKSATKGYSGSNGSSSGAFSGKVYIASTLTSTISGGAAGSAGGASSSGSTPFSTTYSVIYHNYSATISAQGGLSGASIGTGGGGAGGAGSAGVCIGGGATAAPGDHGDSGSNGAAATESTSTDIGYFSMNTEKVPDSGVIDIASYIDNNSEGLPQIPRIIGLSFAYSTMPKDTKAFNTVIDGSGTDVIDINGKPYALYFSNGSVIENSTDNVTLYAIKNDTSFVEISATTTGQTLLDGWYYVTANTTCSNTTVGGNGLNIGTNDVKIYIKSGCTLTVTGHDANGTTGAGAGIYLTTGKLYVYGYGSLIVTGGKGANGGNPGTSSISYQSSQVSGYGPYGGYGGGGAGAGIGTTGGTGGAQTAANTIYGSGSDFTANGNAGASAAAYNGTVWIANTINATINGGAAGSNGTSKNAGYSGPAGTGYINYYLTYPFIESSHGGGAGAPIGTGGYGGGGSGTYYRIASNSGSTGTVGTHGADGNPSSASASTELGYFIFSNPDGVDSGVISPIYLDTDESIHTSYIPRISGFTFHYTTFPDGVLQYEDEDGLVVVSKDVKNIDTKYLEMGTVIEFGTTDVQFNAVFQNGPWLKINDTWIKGTATYYCANGKWVRATLYTKKDGHWYENSPFD